MDLNSICANLREASQKLSLQSAEQKNISLSAVCSSIEKNKSLILEANAVDVKNARSKGMSESLVERLSLDDKKINSIIDSIKIIINQNDPVGEEVAGWKTPKGLTIRQVRVPLGVVAIIYESRPNVTVDAFALAYKSGNSILLRGSSSAINSNKALVKTIVEGLTSSEAQNFGIEQAVYLCPSENHSEVEEILNATGLIDVALPRGGANLINMVIQKAKIPVIQTGAGVCHLFIDKSADLKMAVEIAFNAKTQRPGACNAVETILIHKEILNDFIPLLAQKFASKVELRLDETAFDCLAENAAKIENFSNLKFEKASENDFGFEFLDFVCSVKTVDNVEQAVDFINAHNTKHSESIVTNDRQNARLFQAKVDASCVYVNSSTRFTDGGEFGFGAELGISTQKLHARGPMGIKALTTTKYLIDGDGQTR